MTDTTITALLEELREVDEETFVMLDDIDSMIMWNAPNAHEGNRHPLDELVLNSVIQGCIQRAIAARGWEYQVAYNPHIGPDDRHGQAYIWPRGEVTKCYESEEDTPAAALLAAYIEAKRAAEGTHESR